MNMLRIIALSLFVTLSPFISAQAIEKLGVVAVIGDTPISNLDLADRTQLIIKSSGLSNSPEIRKRVNAQALKQLVDEALQRIEAKRRNINVSNEELAAAIAEVEQQNRQAPGSFKGFMEAKGISWEAFTSQLRAQILWSKMMTQVVRPKVRISETEFNQAAKNQRLLESGKEFNITPLVLTIDSPDREAPLFALAQKVVEEVRGGASLESVMQQLMRLPPGQEPRFWVTPDQLEPALSEPLKSAQAGDILGPIRSQRGIHIMRLNETRNQNNVNVIDPSQVILKEVLLALGTEATPKEVQLTLEIARQVAQNPGTCLEPSIAGIEQYEDADIRVNFLQSTVTDLPAYARQQSDNLNVGEVGEPFATPEGIRFYILCEKVEMPVEVIADDNLRDRLFREKLELEASKFMRELRRDTFIEIRV
jgi:peptidyl-prolyl cis-trans isomerase SurA